MRILYDGYIYSIQSAGGINRYFSNIIKRLPNVYTPILTTSHLRRYNFPNHRNINLYYFKRFGFLPGRISYWLEKRYFKAINSLKTFDLIHPTYYCLLSRDDLNKNVPIVLTVHDMIHEIFYPEDPIVKEKEKMILAAQAIICVSENTKNDLVNKYSINEEKITVIYNASELSINDSYGSETVPHQPYYLYVGSRYEYKNFGVLLDALKKAISINPELKLCVVGPQFTEDELKKINDLKLLDNIYFYSNVTDKHLAKIYRCSIGLVYPSLYEGFGIPPLEAMSCGTVAIIANNSSLPEVVGDAGILFNSNSANDLTSIMLYLQDNPTYREKLVVKGFNRAKTFSWDNTANKTVDLYRSIM